MGQWGGWDEKKRWGVPDICNRQFAETRKPHYSKLAAIKGPRLQLPTSRHWHGHVGGKQANVHTCGQRKRDSGRVPSSASKMASRSRGLQSEERLINMVNCVDQG